VLARVLFTAPSTSFEAAEADCNRALASAQLSPQDRVKALLRRGTARMHKGDLRGARSDFREVLAAEPNNRQAREELKVIGDVLYG
jgi:Tfp pilus assembly protein PilF